MAKNKSKSIPRLADFLFEVGSLRKLIRAHRQSLLTDDLSDSIAAHSFRVTVIAWFLAKEEKADPYKVLMMGLMHDISESRSGDQNWVHKKYVKVYEDEIIKDQMNGLPSDKELKQIMNEYVERKSKEAKIAKDADLLEQILLLKEHAWQGNKEAQDWLKGNQQAKRLASNTAKKLAKEIMRHNPSDWWSNLWTPNRR